MAEDTFTSRVDKIFGSLASSRNPTDHNSPWSITDRQVERREWRRSEDNTGRDEMPFSRSFDACLKNQRNKHTNVEDDLDDLADEEDEETKQSYRDIKSTIGMDKTLDNEEEEDEYDKVAVGRENAGDQLYMSEVTNHGPYLNSHNVLPNSVREATKDQRANHLAARMRLKEDDAEAQNLGPQSSYKTEITAPPVKASAEGNRPKPILKRKNNTEENLRTEKRVRFDPTYIQNSEEASESIQDFPTDGSSMNAAAVDSESILAQKKSKVPDYLLNPSKYTCYSLDSTNEVDDASNKQACMDFLQLIKRSKATGSEDMPVDLPKSVTFIPKKLRDTKMDDSSEVKQKEEGDVKPSFNRAGFPVSIAAIEAENEISDMDEDQPETVTNTSLSFQKSSRSYRTKSRSEETDS